MAFNSDAQILKAEFENLGATVEIDEERRHRLIVNDQYEFCYTNSYYFERGANESLGRGKQSFLKLISPK